jgi:hypothetical protein
VHARVKPVIGVDRCLLPFAGLVREMALLSSDPLQCSLPAGRDTGILGLAEQ